MAKRFIDTSFLSQTWIRKLTPEQKCFLIYIMLECNNAGIIDLDIEAAEFWIGKKIGDPSKFLPGGYLIFIKESGKYFLPKFIFYQYGDLKSNKNIVVQARQILDNHGLLNKENFTLKLPKTYIKVSKKLSNRQITSNSNSIGNSNSNSKSKEENFLLKFNSIKKSKFRVVTKKFKQQLSARIKEGFTEEEILLATEACSKDPYHQENPQYLTPEFITRPDKLEKYLNHARIRNDRAEQKQYEDKFNPATGTGLED